MSCKLFTQKHDGHILFQHVPVHRRKEKCIMTDLEKFIANYEDYTVRDSKINTNEIPELMTLSKILCK